RRHTRFSRDWSSDVCSSDLVVAEKKKLKEDSILGYRYPEFDIPQQARQLYLKNLSRQTSDVQAETIPLYGLSAHNIDLSKSQVRSEERRVGKERTARWTRRT